VDDDDLDDLDFDDDDDEPDIWRSKPNQTPLLINNNQAI
jgi:hypothetical protein